MTNSPLVVNLVGRKFGRLTVAKRVKNDSRGNAKWLCVCDCGNQKEILGSSLRQGLTRSCGCLLAEKASQRMTAMRLKTGLSQTKLYRVWSSMKERCNNKSSKSFKNYGGRGIAVCEQWNDPDKGFENFLNWAHKNGYQEGLEIDRINNNDGYRPDNCRWVSSKDNSRNLRKNVPVCVISKSTGMKKNCRSLSEAEEITGIDAERIRRAINGRKVTVTNYEFESI